MGRTWNMSEYESIEIELQCAKLGRDRIYGTTLIRAKTQSRARTDVRPPGGEHWSGHSSPISEISGRGCWNADLRRKSSSGTERCLLTVKQP